MKAPAFWSLPNPTPAARLLSPLGALYARTTARRVARAPAIRPDIPVICVGNLNAGGTGKTPTVIALIERLTAAGHAPHVISRGHGGSATGPHRVDPRRDRPSETGDEPLLLAAFAPVWVARDRAAGARAAVGAGAECLILDDGFQNPAVAKDLSLITVDAVTGFGNGLCLPAGPLREPVAKGTARADLVLSIGDDAAQAQFPGRWAGALNRLAVSRGRLEPLRMGIDWTGMRVFAFAGIGRPAKFFQSLRGAGADLAGAHALADHQPLAPALLARLERDAATLGAQLVTTEKDAARLPPAWRGRVLTFPVRLRIDDWSELDARLGALGLG